MRVYVYPPMSLSDSKTNSIKTDDACSYINNWKLYKQFLILIFELFTFIQFNAILSSKIYISIKKKNM